MIHLHWTMIGWLSHFDARFGDTDDVAGAQIHNGLDMLTIPTTYLDRI